jgi:hypothetical protein
MKTTTNNNSRQPKSKIIATLIGKTLVASLICLLPGTSFSQTTTSQTATATNNKVVTGVSISSQVSANGYGGSTLPALYVKNGRRSLFAGPVIQNRNFKMSGVQLNYTYSLTGLATGSKNPYEPELFAFVSGAYNYKALMGQHTLREEQLANPSCMDNHITSYSFRSAELFAGVGLRLKVLKRFQWTNSVGLGGYASFNFPTAMNLYYNASNIGLVLRTGILFDIN